MSEALWSALPDRPGVYLMVDRRARVLYVGRSVQLRTRVRSYWTSPDPWRPHLDGLLRRVAAVEHVACKNEHAAAFLERELIARHDPPFNRTVGVESEWWLQVRPGPPPKLESVRHPEPNTHGLHRFGPFLGGRRVRLALAALRRLYLPAGADRLVALLEGDPGELAACLAALELKRDRAADATLFEGASELQETIRAVGWLAQASSAAPSDRGSAPARHLPGPSTTIA